MPRAKCPKCQKAERILKSGIIRGKQRFYCKDCNYHFTLIHENKKQKNIAKKNNGQTSLKDIAEAAGVSITTVSRALKDYQDVSSVTKNMIKELAASMKYQPNLLAQSLVNRTTHSLGVIIPNLDTPFFPSMLSGIQQMSAQAGYRVVICQSDEDHNVEVANLIALSNNMIDGLLVCHTLNTATFEHIRLQLNNSIPIVSFYRVAEELDIPKVYSDDENGAYQVTEHLILSGCKRIALLLGPVHMSITQKRKKGYLNALKKHQISFDEDLLAYIDFSLESIKKTIDKLVETPTNIDAVFSISDKGAVHVIQYLKEKNFKIPEEISVAGYGNEYTGEMIEPHLTTFDVHTKQIGEAAARMLIEKIITKNSSNSTETIKGNLIVRESTKKAQN